ncbi:20328_t:CDS:1, partial [Dentiscutata erythropus]
SYEESDNKASVSISTLVSLAFADSISRKEQESLKLAFAKSIFC